MVEQPGRNLILRAIWEAKTRVNREEVEALAAELSKPKFWTREKLLWLVLWLVIIATTFLLTWLGVLDNSYDLGNPTSTIVVKEYHG